MATEDTGSITCWIDVLKCGEGAVGVTPSPALNAAVQALWERYSDRLIRLARVRLRPASGVPLAMPVDEEDVALCAFESFCRMVVDGRYVRLDGRDDLWRLLVTLTVRKAANERKSALRVKRGGGRILDEAALENGQGQPPVDGEGRALSRFEGASPRPELVAMVAEEFGRLLALLEKPEHRDIALRRLEGYTNAEIAAQLDCTERTIERKLDIIRTTWTAAGVSPLTNTSDA